MGKHVIDVYAKILLGLSLLYTILFVFADNDVMKSTFLIMSSINIVGSFILFAKFEELDQGEMKCPDCGGNMQIDDYGAVCDNCGYIELV